MEMDSLVVSENKDENPISCDIYVGQLRSEMWHSSIGSCVLRAMICMEIRTNANEEEDRGPLCYAGVYII